MSGAAIKSPGTCSREANKSRKDQFQTKTGLLLVVIGKVLFIERRRCNESVSGSNVYFGEVITIE